MSSPVTLTQGPWLREPTKDQWIRLVGRLVASGWLADRVGRKAPLMISIFWYSICNLIAGFSPSFAFLIFFRALLGIGMGAEWPASAWRVLGPVAVCRRDLQSVAELPDRRLPTEVRATASAFTYHTGAISGGLVAPVLTYLRSVIISASPSRCWSAPLSALSASLCRCC